MDINWGSFRKREITLRVLKATAVHVLGCQYMDNVTAPPLPPLPFPVKRTLSLFSLTAVSFGIKAAERKPLLCFSGHFSHVLLALSLRGSDMSVLFHITWPFHHLPWLGYFASDLSTCLFPPRSNVLCAFLFQWIKRDLTEDPQPRSLHSHGN